MKALLFSCSVYSIPTIPIPYIDIATDIDLI